jgi:hypothetical protein
LQIGPAKRFNLACGAPIYFIRAEGGWPERFVPIHECRRAGKRSTIAVKLAQLHVVRIAVVAAVALAGRKQRHPHDRYR